MQTIFASILLCSSLIAISCTNNEVTPQQKTALTSSQSTPAQTGDTHAGHQHGDISKAKRITISEADTFSKENKAVIVDVRGVEAYERAHIKGSINVSLSKIQRGDLSDFSKIPKDQRIITYCSCHAENTSSQAALILEKAGYTNVFALVGGFTAWENAGKAVTRTEQK